MCFHGKSCCRLRENAIDCEMPLYGRELAKRKAGGQGSFIVDDDRKYPQKESLGPLSARKSHDPARPA